MHGCFVVIGIVFCIIGLMQCFSTVARPSSLPWLVLQAYAQRLTKLQKEIKTNLSSKKHDLIKNGLTGKERSQILYRFCRAKKKKVVLLTNLWVKIYHQLLQSPESAAYRVLLQQTLKEKVKQVGLGIILVAFGLLLISLG